MNFEQVLQLEDSNQELSRLADSLHPDQIPPSARSNSSSNTPRVQSRASRSGANTGSSRMGASGRSNNGVSGGSGRLHEQWLHHQSRELQRKASTMQTKRIKQEEAKDRQQDQWLAFTRDSLLSQHQRRMNSRATLESSISTYYVRRKQEMLDELQMESAQKEYDFLYGKSDQEEALLEMNAFDAKMRATLKAQRV